MITLSIVIKLLIWVYIEFLVLIGEKVKIKEAYVINIR